MLQRPKRSEDDAAPAHDGVVLAALRSPSALTHRFQVDGLLVEIKKGLHRDRTEGLVEARPLFEFASTNFAVRVGVAVAIALSIFDRRCGGCDECCRVVAVDELNKPQHTSCIHQTGAGCAIHGAHPDGCKSYKCFWRHGILPEPMRPDKIGVLVDAEGGDEWAVIQECRPGALDTPAGRELVRRVAGSGKFLRRGIRIEPHGAHTDAGSRGTPRLGRYREIAPKVYMYVGSVANDVGDAAR